MPAMKTYREAIFSGWFGPMGVGAVFLSIIAKEELELVYEGKEAPISIQLISPVVLFIVFCSVIVHGTTIPVFKLGKRIRTRTLSITSISSNQVLRLPKLQFGQQLHKKDGDHHHHHHDKEEHEGGGIGLGGGLGAGGGGMTELERNTLFNTLQHDTNSSSGNTTIHIDISSGIKHENSDSEDLLEEDFLPDDSASINRLKLHPPPITNSNSSSDDPLETTEDVRRTSAVSLDTQQAIRFLEPVKPRMTNVEKNETSASSLKSWLLRHPSNYHHHQKEAAVTTNLESGGVVEEQHYSQHGIKNFIKRLANHHHTTAGCEGSSSASSGTNTPTASNEEHQHDLKKLFAASSASSSVPSQQEKKVINPRIEVWEENNHVVVEDIQGDEVIIIDKSAHPSDWKKATVESIKKVENDLEKKLLDV